MAELHRDPLVRVARFVGDFSSPFLEEERQRDVWNEASAFGLQLTLWFSLLAGTVTIWLVGEPALPYVCGGMGLAGVVSIATVAYAERLGVTMNQASWMRRWRMLPYTLLVVVLAVGLLRAGPDQLSGSSLAGMAAGAASVLGLAAAASRTAARRSRG